MNTKKNNNAANYIERFDIPNAYGYMCVTFADSHYMKLWF
jgi:hypothetical protein